MVSYSIGLLMVIKMWFSMQMKGTQKIHLIKADTKEEAIKKFIKDSIIIEEMKVI